MLTEISCRVRVQSPTTRNLFRTCAAQFATNSPRRARPEIHPLSEEGAGLTGPGDFSDDEKC